MLIQSYHSADPILLAVDCVIFGFDQNKLKLLIFKREVDPLAGQWSLIGSFIKPDEGADEAALRVLSEITGITGTYMEQLHTFGAVNRDKGGRVISIAYWNLIKIQPEIESFKVKNHISKWVDINKVPDLILDHNDMTKMAIARLREKAKYKPIGFELIPEEFTLPQLLNVYQAIFQREIDDRNFRKKMLKSGLLTQTNKKDKRTSKKGSYLYRFNNQRYITLLQEGYNFEI